MITISSESFAQSGVMKNESNYKAHADGWMVDINKAYEVSKKNG